MEKSYDIQTEEISYLNSSSYLKSSWLELLPSLSLSASKSNPVWGDWSNSAGLSLSKSVYSNVPTYFSIKHSLIDKKNAELSKLNIQKNIAFNIFSKFLNVLEAQKSYQIQLQNLELQRKINAQIKVQFDSGEKSYLELKQSEVVLIDNEIAVNEYENSLIKLREDLFSYLNIEDEDHPFVEPDLEFEQTEADFKLNLNLKMQQLNIESTKLSLLQQKFNFFPTISLGYSLNHGLSNTKDNYGYDRLLGFGHVFDFDDYERSQSFSINASYSIFNLLDIRESYVISKRSMKSLQLSFEKSEKTHNNELSNLKKDIKSLRKTYELYETKLELSEENLKLAQEQFRLGAISLLDLDNTKLDFQNSQLSFIKKHYELIRKQEEINLLLSEKILGRW